MMNIVSIFSTRLAYVVIPFECFMFLGLPVWASLFTGNSIQILWMILFYSMFISTFTRAIFTYSSSFMFFNEVFFVDQKRIPTSNTFSGHLRRFWSFLYCFILTLWGTVSSSTVFQSGWYDEEFSTTVFTYPTNSFFHAESINQTWDGVK